MTDIPPPSVAGAEPLPTAAGARGRVLRGVLAKTVAVAVAFAQQVLLLPIFLWAWGPELYRDWLTLTATVALLTLFDCGLNTYFSNALLITWSRGERAAFLRKLRVGLGHYAVLLGAVAPLVLLAVPFAPWQALLHLVALDRTTAVAALFLLAAFVLAGLPLGMVIAVYRARGFLATDVLAASAYLFVPVAASAAALALGAGPVVVAALHLASNAAFWLMIVWRQRRRFPELSFIPVLPRRDELREMVATAPFYAVVPISLILTVHVTLLLVSGLGAEVVLFATLRTLTGFARTVTDQVGQIVGIELARRHAQGGAAARLYRFLGRFQGAINGALSGLVLVLGPPFVAIWTLGKVPMDFPVFAVLLAVVALAAPGQAAERLLANINRPAGLATAFLARGVTTVVIAAALIPWLGTLGAAIAVLISDVVVLGVLLPRAAAAAAGVGALRQTVTAQSAAAVSFGIGAVVAYAIAALTGTGGLVAILAAGVIWCVLAAAPIWFLVLDAGTRRWFADGVRRRLRGVT